MLTAMYFPIKMIASTCFMLFLVSVVSFAQTDRTTTWAPVGQINCRTHADCGDTQRVCCSKTFLLGKRRRQTGGSGVADFYPYVHYCLPYKTTDNPWCSLHMQYSAETPIYAGLCPCGPGLKCTPTEELDPQYYPRDRYGKCTPA